jgi:hypothetical protein
MEGPQNKIPRENFDAFKIALIEAANAPPKAAAESNIAVAEYRRHVIRHFLTYYVDEQLFYAIDSAKLAAGKAKNKERLMENASQYRLKFEGYVTVE